MTDVGGWKKESIYSYSFTIQEVNCKICVGEIKNKIDYTRFWMNHMSKIYLWNSWWVMIFGALHWVASERFFFLGNISGFYGSKEF